jgi:hypothetical protein
MKPITAGRRGRGKKNRTPGFTVTRSDLESLIYVSSLPGIRYAVITSGFAGIDKPPETHSWPVACAMVRTLRDQAFARPGLFPALVQQRMLAFREQINRDVLAVEARP